MTKKVFEYHKSKSEIKKPYQIIVEHKYIEQCYSEIYQTNYANSVFATRYGAWITVIDTSVTFTETSIQFTSYFNPTHHFTIPFNYIKQIYY